jgi:molybdenum cofactor biosynthesis enzyme
MLHRCLFHLAKKKGPPPRRHGLRRNVRRSGSSSGGASGSAAAKRSGKEHPSAAALSKGSSATKQLFDEAGTAAGKGTGGETEAGAAALGTSASAGAVALVSDESNHPQPNSTRRPLYRLATAVATVVVPPTTNVYLQSMKHLLTPAASPGMASASIGDAVGSATPAVPIVEEYYTSKKGPLFATAVVAGTNAVKQVSSLIPFCYPTPIQRCSFTFRRRQVVQAPRPSQMPHRVVLRRRTSAPGPTPNRPEYSVLYCFCTVATESRAGVEMEALTGAAMASVTLYDMLKGLPGAQEDGLSLGEAFVLAKRGGRNDFTKLLMSEPARPLVESGTRNRGEMLATLSLKSSTDAGTGNAATTASQATNAASATDSPPTPPENNTTPRQPSNGADDSGDDTAMQRVTRRAVSAAAATSEYEEGQDPNLPGETGAWWRTSKHEKRLQELYPRRKYVEGSRLVPTAPSTTAEAVPPPKETVAAGPSASKAPVDEPAPPPKPKHVSKASIIREGRSVTSAASAKGALRAAREAAAHKEGEAEVAEGEDGDAEAVVKQRRPARSRLAKKSGRGVVAAADDVDDAPAKDMTPDEEAAEEDEETHDADDDVEQGKEGKRGKRGSPSNAAAHKPAKIAAKKQSAAAAAAQRRQQAVKAAEEAEAEEVNEGLEEDNAAEEEEVAVTATRKSSHANTATSTRRHSKTSDGSAHAASPTSKSNGTAAGRKQRTAAAAALTHKKGRAVDMEDEDGAQEDVVGDDMAEGEENDDADTSEALLEEEEEEE